MDATTLVSVEEYLCTSFPDADREYIDGRHRAGDHETKDGMLRAQTASLEVPLSEIFD